MIKNLHMYLYGLLVVFLLALATKMYFMHRTIITLNTNLAQKIELITALEKATAAQNNSINNLHQQNAELASALDDAASTNKLLQARTATAVYKTLTTNIPKDCPTAVSYGISKAKELTWEN